MYWSSHKQNPNYLIKALYAELSKLPAWKQTKDKYGFILEYMEKGYITVYKTDDEQIQKGFKRIKTWNYRVKKEL